jgi:hypothetical protein
VETLDTKNCCGGDALRNAGSVPQLPRCVAEGKTGTERHGGAGVAGDDTDVGGALVSKSATLARTTATLFYVYDSLIEKCSTLPVV